jgi:ketosteroid isomerase-like protein
MTDAHDGGWANYLHRLATAAAGRDPGPDPLADERVPSASDLDAGIATRELVVRAFNDAIDHRDLDRLAALMTDDHRFVDTADAVVEGKPACVEVWRSFFEAFPDYRNHFETFHVDGDRLIVEGHSTCSEPALAGPARWRVEVVHGLVREWRVEDP